MFNDMSVNILKKPLTLFFLISSFGLFLINCSSAKDKESYDFSKDNPIFLSDIFQDARIIQLETTDHNLIAQITQVEFYKEKFYILDSKQQKIFSFDNTGRFLFKISNQGKGPQEYQHIVNFTIDTYNNNLILLSPPDQTLIIYDLEGNFIEKQSIKSDHVLGLNKVYCLNDSIILLSSITDYQIVFFNRNKVHDTKMDYHLPTFLYQLLPVFNTYQFNGKTFINPALSQELIEVTTMKKEEYLSFDYGSFNNSDQQISRLLNEFEKSLTIRSKRLHELFSSGYINNLLIKSMESERFIIKHVATEMSIKHVIKDKITKKTFVFNEFKDGVRINMHFAIHLDKYLIAYEARNFKDEASNREFFGPWYSFYTAEYYNKNFLTHEDQSLIDSRDPLTENPFLVVYKFKE
jgi:hypothetical protein